MNVTRSKIPINRIAGLGSRFYRTDVKIPNDIELKLEKDKWDHPFSEKESLFAKLLKSLKIRKNEKRIIMSAEDFTYENIKMWYKSNIKTADIQAQCYLIERHETLGNEIATAHFIVYRGGKVKFHGQDSWIKCEKGEDYYENLPKSFHPGVFLDGIDAEGMKLYYEGLENLKGLARLRWLSLKNSPLIDDWCLDRVAAQLKDTLEYLDISDCKNITHRGISCLYKFNKLKVLKVHNIADSPHFQLSCLMLEDVNPHLTIEGVKYLELEEKIAG